jgi:hypothetical protein
VSEQILTFGRELHAAPETVEQLHLQLCLERKNLAGQRWLTEVQPGDSAPEAASVDDTHERAEVSQLHRLMRSSHIGQGTGTVRS